MTPGQLWCRGGSRALLPLYTSPVDGAPACGSLNVTVVPSGRALLLASSILSQAPAVDLAVDGRRTGCQPSSDSSARAGPQARRRPGAVRARLIYDILISGARSNTVRTSQQTNPSGNCAWEVLDARVAKGGNCSPGDFEEFGFNSPQAMVPHIKTLEDANVIQSSTSDEDRRRKTIAVTPRGRLVRYARSGYLLPE